MDNEVNRIQDINRPKLQGNVNIQETEPNTFTNFSDGKNNDNSRGMVEELTLKNFNKGKLELVGASKPNIWEDSDSISFSEFLEKNQEIQKNQNETTENETQQPSPGIRTKILSKSGFSEFFVKNTLKGKGVIFRGPPRDGVGAHEAKPSVSPKNESLNMREWLNKGGNKRDKSRNVYVFKKILDLVDSSHSQGVALQSLKPSCFKLLPSNHVLYLGSLENGDGVLRKRKVGDNRNSFGMWPNRSHDVKLGLSSFNGDLLEEQWYSSHEDVKERRSTLSSNIYSLGVLLFELLGSFESAREHVVAMMNLGQRILPPRFLSENPKEAGYCLWMLHPEAPARPTTRDILKSNLVSGLEETSTDDLISSISQEETESEILSHFLASLKEQKQKHATKLVQNIHCLESDITEVESRRESNSFPKSIFGESRLKTNLSHLESAYFSVRSSIEIDPTDTVDRENNKPLDRLGMFFNGLCKYARYSKFEVRGNLRGGDFSSSANVICSLGFDRDEDYFATAGVSKKIKVYDFSLLLDDSVDIHYPAVEMSNKSKLSCICWNTYIKNYLASTDYDGVVKIWDAGSGQAVSHHVEHERRAWSVDFSRVDPTKFVSGSDDCFVKLWSINEKKSLSTIKNIANVCCVQFSPYSPHLLSFGSADYRTYCYDVRNISTPLCILAGHDRAVSYVKFLDSETLVSASTDNTLKLWDLNKTNDCILTFKGHTNEKNFVGLCVADGYIACGSETNEVFAYHRSLPMPITAHKFGSIDPVSGKETDHGNNQFVSSVCWRQKSDMVIAANSSGCLKLLQMV